MVIEKDAWGTIFFQFEYSNFYLSGVINSHVTDIQYPNP